MPNFTWRTNTRQRLSVSFPELRCSLAVTAKKCTKKRDARIKLLFCQSGPIAVFAVLVDGAVVVAYEHNRKQILCSDWLPQLTGWAYSMTPARPPPPLGITGKQRFGFIGSFVTEVNYIKNHGLPCLVFFQPEILPFTKISYSW